MTIVYSPITFTNATFTVKLDKNPGYDNVVVTLKIYPGLPTGVSVPGASAAQQAIGGGTSGVWNFSTDGNYLGFDGGSSITKVLTFTERETQKTVTVPIPPKYLGTSMFDDKKAFYVKIESVTDGNIGDKSTQYCVINYAPPMPRVDYVAPGTIGSPNNNPINPPPPPSGGGGGGGDCFLIGSLITMADGSKKAIQYLKKGDKIKSAFGGINKVIDIEEKLVKAGRTLYSINGEKPFATDDHPMYQNGKLVSLNHKFSSMRFPWLGDILPAVNVKTETLKQDSLMYNLVLDGDHTHIVNETPVHNIVGYGDIAQAIYGVGACTKEEFYRLVELQESEDTYDIEASIGYYKLIMPIARFIYASGPIGYGVAVLLKKAFFNDKFYQFALKTCRWIGGKRQINSPTVTITMDNV